MENTAKDIVKPVGRPTKYTEELGAKICDMVTEGKSFSEISAACDISHASWLLWKDTIPSFSALYSRARQDANALKLDRLERMMDDDSKDVLVNPTTGQYVINTAAVARAREKAQCVKMSLAYQRSLGSKGIAAAKTADDVMQLVQDKLENGEISYEEAEKLAKLAESRMRITEQSELKPMLQEALDKIAKHDESR
jgi:hypothetical protein